MTTEATFLTVEEVALALRRDKWAVYKLIQAGELRGVHPPGFRRSIRVLPEDLEAYRQRSDEIRPTKTKMR